MTFLYLCHGGWICTDMRGPVCVRSMDELLWVWGSLCCCVWAFTKERGMWQPCPCYNFPIPLMRSYKEMGMKSEIGNMLSGGINFCPWLTLCWNSRRRMLYRTRCSFFLHQVDPNPPMVLCSPCCIFLDLVGPLLWVCNHRSNMCFLMLKESTEKNLPVLWGSGLSCARVLFLLVEALMCWLIPRALGRILIISIPVLPFL